MELDTVKIILSFPGCGSDVWVRNDGGVRCLSCGDEVSPEDMVPLIEPVVYEC